MHTADTNRSCLFFFIYLHIIIWNYDIFELRLKIELYGDHRSEDVSTKAVEKKKPEKIQAWTAQNQTHDLCDTGAAL